MRQRRASVCLGLAFFLLQGAVCQASDPFRFPEGSHKQGELRYRNGIPVLIVAGKPEEMGEQAAELAGKPAVRLLKYPQELLDQLATPVVARLLMPKLQKVSRELYENFPAEYKAELESAARQSGCDRELLIFANTLFDQKHLLASFFGCSAVIVEKDRSGTGQPIFGRNMDYMSLGYLHEYSLVTIYHPRGKRSFASIGYPGTIGVISGINDAGLAIASLETTGTNKEQGPAFDPAGTPFLLNYRQILEECSTVGEAYKLLSRQKKTTTQHLAVCDREGGAIFEYTPTTVIRRGPEQGTCRCTNHFISEQLRLKKPINLFTTLDRLARLDQCCHHSGKIGLEEIKTYLNSVNQKSLTLQSMIFEPRELRLHLAVAQGTSPSSAQAYRTLDLEPLLRGGK